MRTLGVTMAYNEVDCIGNAARCLLGGGHREVIVFDHGSTDGTAEAAEAAAAGDRRLRVMRVSRRTCNFPQLFRRISTFIRSRAGEFDWVTWIAADEILRPPEGGALRPEHLERAWARGVRVIRPLLREFWISDADPSEAEVPDYLHRLRYYRERPEPNCPRGWAIGLTGVMPHGLHRRAQDWPGRPRISHNRWLLDHYPIRSHEQARRKIMHERPWGPEHYRRHRAEGCAGIARPAANLRRAEPCRS